MLPDFVFSGHSWHCSGGHTGHTRVLPTVLSPQPWITEALMCQDVTSYLVSSEGVPHDHLPILSGGTERTVEGQNNTGLLSPFRKKMGSMRGLYLPVWLQTPSPVLQGLNRQKNKWQCCSTSSHHLSVKHELLTNVRRCHTPKCQQMGR